MRPVQTEASNVRLSLPNDTTGDGDLPAERCVDQDGRQLIETVWRPSPEERELLTSGADVTLRVWGAGHPPVSIGVTAPPASTTAAWTEG